MKLTILKGQEAKDWKQDKDCENSFHPHQLFKGDIIDGINAKEPLEEIDYE